jgi:hypothetical protein
MSWRAPHGLYGTWEETAQLHDRLPHRWIHLEMVVEKWLDFVQASLTLAAPGVTV